MIVEASPAEIEPLWPILEEMRRANSLYDEGFPDYFEDYLFLYESYLDDRGIFEAIVHANGLNGRESFLFLPKEFIAGEPYPDLLVPNEQWPELYDRIIDGLEFYLAAVDGTWLVWAYHEPCLHIAGSTVFIETVKSGIHDWEGRQSPWYEPGSIPVCACGVWWQPDWGNWRTTDWQCPNCSGSSAN